MTPKIDLTAELVKSFFTGRGNGLEKTISFLEKTLNITGFREIPEYQTAVDALRAYGNAAAAHYLGEVKGRNGDDKTTNEIFPVSVGMRNTLKSLLSLQKTKTDSRHFPAAIVYVHNFDEPYTMLNPMWSREESPQNALEVRQELDSALEQYGLLDKTVIDGGPKTDYVGFRIKQDKISQVERLIGEQ